MKRDPVRAALLALADAARHPKDDASVALVRASLAHRSNQVVALYLQDEALQRRVQAALDRRRFPPRRPRRAP